MRRFACALLLLGCSASSAKEDRAKVLEALTEKVMLPGYRELDQRALGLGTAMSAHCSAPTPQSLDAAKSAWRAARGALRRTAAFQFGPTEELRAPNNLDFWPVRENDIEKAIADAPAVIDDAYLSKLGASQKGLPALEYLLFASGVGTPERCAYAEGLAREIATRSHELALAWEKYAPDLVHAGEDGSSIASTQAGVNLALTSTNSALVELTDRTLARPLGEKSGGVPQPEECESRYSGDSIVDYRSALLSVNSMWVGAPSGQKGKGLTLLVRRKDIPFDESVRSSIALIDERASAIDAPLSDEVVNDKEPVQSTLEAARDLRRIMATEVVQVMGGTLGFTDNDGD
jgi:predicted lipoprotein